MSATCNRTTSYLQVWRILSRGRAETPRCCAQTEEEEKRMGPFWKKMLRLSSARSRGLTHGADSDASEVSPEFSKVIEHSWNCSVRQGGGVFAGVVPVFLHCLPVNSKSSEEISVKFSGIIDNRTRNRWLHLGDVVDYRLDPGIFQSILYHRLAKVFVL